MIKRLLLLCLVLKTVLSFGQDEAELSKKDVVFYSLEEAIQKPKEVYRLYLNDVVNITAGLEKSLHLLKNLEELKIVYCDTVVLPESISELKNLRIISIYTKYITALPDAVNQLKKLEVIEIRSKEFSLLPDLSKCENLKKIHIFGTHDLTQPLDIPESIWKLKQMESLTLAGIKLSVLPESIGNLTNLKALDLSANELVSLPEAIGNCTLLKEIHLSGNQLKEFPKRFFNLTHLEKIYASDNQLQPLSDDLGKLVSLRSIELAKNNLTSIPVTLCDLKELSYIGLIQNPLELLPPELVQLPLLESISVDDTVFEIHPELKELKVELDSLFRERKVWHSISETLYNSPEIVYHLSLQNVVGEIPDFESIGELYNLKTLKISGTDIQELPKSIGMLKNLQLLDLSHNKLSYLPDTLTTLRNLEKMYLDSNWLYELPYRMSEMKKLEILDVSSNQLHELPLDIGNISTLKEFKIVGNPLKTLPESIKNFEIYPTILRQGDFIVKNPEKFALYNYQPYMIDCELDRQIPYLIHPDLGKFSLYSDGTYKHKIMEGIMCNGNLTDSLTIYYYNGKIKSKQLLIKQSDTTAFIKGVYYNLLGDTAVTYESKLHTYFVFDSYPSNWFNEKATRTVSTTIDSVSFAIEENGDTIRIIDYRNQTYTAFSEGVRRTMYNSTRTEVLKRYVCPASEETELTISIGKQNDWLVLDTLSYFKKLRVLRIHMYGDSISQEEFSDKIKNIQNFETIQQLKKIELFGDMEVLPEFVYHCQNLENLDFSRSKICYVSGKINQCKKLKVLRTAEFSDVSDYKELIDHIAQLPNLEILEMPFDCVNEIPENIKRLEGLRILELTNYSFEGKMHYTYRKKLNHSEIVKFNKKTFKRLSSIPGLGYLVIDSYTDFNLFEFYKKNQTCVVTRYEVCFPANTLITKSGNSTSAISELKIGDVLLTLNETTGGLDTTKVINKFIHPVSSRKMVEFHFTSDTTTYSILATLNHPFYVSGQWKDAEQLQIGDAILFYNEEKGKFDEVAIHEKKYSELENTSIYNITTTKHTYIANGVLVHNK